MSPVWSLVRRQESSSFQSRDLHNLYQFTCMPLFPSDAAKFLLSMNGTMGLRTELYVFSRQPNFQRSSSSRQLEGGLSFCGIKRNNQQVTNNRRFKFVRVMQEHHQAPLFQWQHYKAILRTVKFSTTNVNSLCFEFEFRFADLQITHLF